MILRNGWLIMKKIGYILLAGLSLFSLSDKAFADKEKENFQSIAESIKSYSNACLSDKEIENDFCAKKFEAQEVFSKWDKLLNEVYQYLKKTKSADEFNNIKQQQRKWIKDKEAKAKSVSEKPYDDRQEKEFQKYNVYIDFTAKRCEELINLVENNTKEPSVNKTEQQIQYEKFQDALSSIERIDRSTCSDGMLAQYEINNMSYRVSQKWETLMKEMLSYLKDNLSDEDYSVINSDQERCVKEAEAKANEASKDWEGGTGEAMARNSAYTEVWSKRCRALLEDVKKYVINKEKPIKTSEVSNETKPVAKASTKKEFLDTFENIKTKESAIANSDISKRNELFKELDKLLNDVYKHMKNTLSSEDFEIVKQAQRDWIKEKEAAAKEALANNQDGNGELNKINSDIEFTKTRVEILIDLLEE